MIDEVLSLMIKKAASMDLIAGFKPAPQGTVINHLQFADDLIVFIDDNTEQISNLKNILFAFELIYVLRVNFKKSVVLPVGETQNARACADLFGCSCISFPVNYLGISLDSKSKASSVWETILQKFQRKLNSWQREYISKGGRIILVNIVLSSFPIYYLSLFQLPKSVEKEMERIMRHFILGGSKTVKKKGWVGWDRDNTSKENGDVGIKKLNIMNKALHAKCIWRYGNEKDALWRKVVNQKFDGNSMAFSPNS
ncbi:uncharacterized protein LOC113312857 [Papaver somniferum]|uniref:uncharacterized protein LOC113312857 n=1 Tax=Papaver somniferum TaxID=3469 RepID=UPI000E701C6A|nr:uncharacterized protein LOC113312857 [Papaver somniferum]